MAQEKNLEQFQLIRMAELLKLLRVSRSTLYSWINKNNPNYQSFPKPIRLSNSTNGSVAWKLIEVIEFIESRAAERN